MAYWLFKSEPNTWSWEQQLACGKKGTCWDGVRNHQANANMKKMRLGEQGFFYHSGEERAIVGIVQVIRLHYPDPKDASARFGMVDVAAVRAARAPVTLARIKAQASLQDMALVRQGRLSVSPVSAPAWRLLCRWIDG